MNIHGAKTWASGMSPAIAKMPELITNNKAKSCTSGLKRLIMAIGMPQGAIDRHVIQIHAPASSHLPHTPAHFTKDRAAMATADSMASFNG